MICYFSLFKSFLAAFSFLDVSINQERHFEFLLAQAEYILSFLAFFCFPWLTVYTVVTPLHPSPASTGKTHQKGTKAVGYFPSLGIPLDRSVSCVWAGWKKDVD